VIEQQQPSERHQRLELVRAVEREYQDSALAVGMLLEEAINQGEFARVHRLDPASIRETRENLERTYTVRIYAEFEATLRTYWRDWRGRTTQPPTQHLIDALTPNLTPQDWIDQVHAVRRYRNALVHEGADSEASFTLAQCRKHICRFLSLLDANW